MNKTIYPIDVIKKVKRYFEVEDGMPVDPSKEELREWESLERELRLYSNYFVGGQTPCSVCCDRRVCTKKGVVRDCFPCLRLDTAMIKGGELLERLKGLWPEEGLINPAIRRFVEKSVINEIEENPEHIRGCIKARDNIKEFLEIVNQNLGEYQMLKETCDMIEEFLEENR